MIQTVDMSLRQVVVFDLAPRSMTPNAVAIIQTGWSLMRSFGPGLGGLLILWLGPGGNFLIQAFAYGLITLTITGIQFPSRTLSANRNSAFENIREGFNYIRKERDTRTFMLIGFVLPVFIIPIFTILPPIYAADVFHGGADTLGYLMSSVGVGGIAGGLVTASLGRIERRGIVQLVSLFILGFMLIAFAFCETLWMALVFLMMAGFFEMIFLTTNQTLLQLSIPDAIRGRVTSLVNLNAVLSPMGGLLAGMGSDFFKGPKIITIIMAGIAAGIAVFALMASPNIRNYRLSEAISRNPAISSKDTGN
jgi:predicted MFS family arabinose efflux permease